MTRPKTDRVAQPKDADTAELDVLRRMLATPPKKHDAKPATAKKKAKK